MTARFFAATLPTSGAITLDGPEAHHLAHVLRLTPGACVELFDGRGGVAAARIAQVRKRDVELVVEQHRLDSPPSPEIVLAVAVPKGERFDWLVEKATELGVARLTPLVTERSSVDPRDSKLDRLRQLVIAACKQSGRNHLLELSPVQSWRDFVAAAATDAPWMLADPTGPPFHAGLLPATTARRTLAIGPEGGWTADELALADAAGAVRVSLGATILRIETAALALAALLRWL